MLPSEDVLLSESLRAGHGVLLVSCWLGRSLWPPAEVTATSLGSALLLASKILLLKAQHTLVEDREIKLKMSQKPVSTGSQVFCMPLREEVIKGYYPAGMPGCCTTACQAKSATVQQQDKGYGVTNHWTGFETCSTGRNLCLIL